MRRLSEPHRPFGPHRIHTSEQHRVERHRCLGVALDDGRALDGALELPLAEGREGGGEELFQKAADSLTGGEVKVVACGPYSREALASRVPIRTFEDLQGKKIRSPEGLVSAVFAAAGAPELCQNMSPPEEATSIDHVCESSPDTMHPANSNSNITHPTSRYMNHRQNQCSGTRAELGNDPKQIRHIYVPVEICVGRAWVHSGALAPTADLR